MKRKFDFVIEKDEGYFKKVLRFYPRHSYVHGFHDDSPTKWEEVYKTYMTFSILRYYEDDDKVGAYETPDKLFSYHMDEGEGLRALREVLSEMLSEESKDEYEIIPFGDGIDWEIYKYKKNEDYFVFNMVNDYSGVVHRFYVEKNQIQDFYNVLNEFLEYMLVHSQGI